MMQIEPFALERYFAKHEFSAKYLLSSSDCEALSMADLLTMADEESLVIWKELKLGYTESRGHPLLRQEISELYDGISEDEIVVCVPEEGIFLLMQALLRPGDHVVAIFPGYQSLYQIAHALGCHVSKWEPEESDGWKFDMLRLKKILRPETRMVIANFPHNPTGYVPTANDFEILLGLVRERGLYLFSDEMYRFLEIDRESTLPSACDQYDRAFSLFGMSKTFGLPGLRLGWLASKDKVTLDRVIELKDYTTICNSAPSEILSLIALRNRKKIIDRQKNLLKSNLEFLDAFMEHFEDHFKWNRPIGGSICFPRMLKVHSTLQFCEWLVKEKGIMLVPSQMFQYGDQHVRIGFGRVNFQDALARFGDILDRL